MIAAAQWIARGQSRCRKNTMAILHNCSDRWLLKKAFKPVLYFLILVIFTAFVLSLMYWHASATANGFAMLFVIAFGVVVARRARWLGRQVAENTESYRAGWFGEMVVGLQLYRLPDTYHVFYDVKLEENKGNTDYIIVSPHGIATLEVKNHRGKRMYGALMHKEYNQALNESRQLHSILEEGGIHAGWVTSVLVRSDLPYLKPELHDQLTVVGLLNVRALLSRVNTNRDPEHHLQEPDIRNSVVAIETLAKCKSRAVIK